MLDIKDAKNPEEFAEWYHSGKWSGCHPFEIVYSSHSHGIHLYPPDGPERVYGLRVTNYAYALDFVEMAEGLMKRGVAFEARDFEQVLAYLCGETYFGVNDDSEHSIHYIPCAEDKKNYFRHVRWDEPKRPAFLLMIENSAPITRRMRR